jgi:hypothetical protein
MVSSVDMVDDVLQPPGWRRCRDFHLTHDVCRPDKVANEHTFYPHDDLVSREGPPVASSRERRLEMQPATARRIETTRGGAGDGARTRDPYLGKVVLYH